MACMNGSVHGKNCNPHQRPGPRAVEAADHRASSGSAPSSAKKALALSRRPADSS